jgi:hypothetical protein
MAIDRKNSFHLLLSDDELKLLRLLAEREGLNASDYLRLLLRRMAGPAPIPTQVIRMGLGVDDLSRLLEPTAKLTTAKAKKRR